MRFQILGPLQVMSGDAVLHLGAPQQRAVLARLLVEVNRVVSVDRLLEDVWGDERPARAAGALHAYISNLRSVLEPQRVARAPASILLSEAPGYVVRASADQVDAHEFEQLVAQARQHSASEAELTLPLLDRALALWRGPMLSDFGDEAWLVGPAARLHEMRAAAFEDRMLVLLHLGRHGEAVSELSEATGQTPLRERLWELLIVALYRSGRQADALHAYQRIRTILADELGIDPGPALVLLERQVLEHDPVLLGITRSNSPNAPQEPRPGRDDGLAARAAEDLANTVHKLGSLVTRVGESRSIIQSIADLRRGLGSCVVVTGAAGVGKTHLVESTTGDLHGDVRVVWGRCVEGDAAPTVWPWIQIAAAMGETGRPLAEVLRRRSDESMGAVASQYEAAASAVLSASEEVPTIVVIDDLQWADAASHRIIQLLLSRVGDLPMLLIVTVRNGAVGQSLGNTMAAFARSHRGVRIELGGFDKDQIRTVAKSVLGGEPADELVGALERRTSGNAFFLSEMLKLIASGSGRGLELDDLAIPASVRDVVMARVSSLPPAAESLLLVASVVGRTFDWRVVCEMTGDNEDAALDAFDSAVVNGLLESASTPSRFRFAHDLVREALYHGMSTPRRARLHARAAIALSNLHGSDRGHSNEVAAQAWLGRSDLPAAAVIAHLLVAVDSAGSMAHSERIDRLRQAMTLVDAMPEGEERDRLEHDVAGRLAPLVNLFNLDPTQESIALLNRARDLQRQYGTTGPHLIQVLLSLCIEAINSADWVAAETAITELRSLSNDNPGPDLSVPIDTLSGLIALHQGHVSAAVRRCERALAALQIGDHDDLSEALGADPTPPVAAILALASTFAGDVDRALQLRNAILDARDGSGGAWDWTVSNYLGYAAKLTDDGEAVLRLAQLGTTTDGDRRFGSLTRLTGWGLARTGNPTAGLSLIEETFVEMAASGLRRRRVATSVYVEVLLMAGHPDRALEAIETELAFPDDGDNIALAELHRVRAEGLVVLGQRDAAHDAYVEGLAIARSQDAWGLARNLEQSCRNALAREIGL